MTVLDIIVIIVLATISVACFIYASSRDEEATLASFLATLFAIVCISTVFSALKEQKPEAIDVYRGQTTLQITYQDSIPVDTVVVWKNNNNNK